MSVELDRLKTRFDVLFNEEGLTNIKFFIDRRPEMSQSDFVAELNKIQETISADAFNAIESVDDDNKKRDFNDAF